MKPTPLLSVLVLLFTCGFASAQQGWTLLFEDDFQRNESQEHKEELAGDWRTNSDRRAGGNKQVDLSDGIMFVFKHESADHAVSVAHPANYKDCRVQLRFRLDDKGDDLGIDFADMQCKEVHAGHICKVFFRAEGIEMLDFKNGRMNKTYRDALKSQTVTPQQKAALKQWQRKIPYSIELKKWHDLVVTIQGDTMSVEMNGKNVGAFSSPGMDHPQKDMIRFSVRREVRMDDVKMFAMGPAKGSTDTIAKAPVNHLFVAKLLLRRLEFVHMTAEQMQAFNKLSADLRKRVDRMRAEVGITKELIRRRDEVYSELKKTDLKGDALWNALQQKAQLTAAQRDVFRETFEQNKKFRADALKLLSEDQKARFRKGKLP